MAQQGQVLKLRSRTADGKPVWTYRYRVNGRRSKRPQVGGFARPTEAQRALQRTLGRLRPGATITLAERVEEYLAVHQAAPATIEKLRWLLAKAIAAFGDARLVDLRSEEICAWRRTLPEEHRFEATQALRQVLNRAVQWQLIESNPARRGVSNPLRRFPEKRRFESWAEIEAIAKRLGPVGGPMSPSLRRPGCVQVSSWRSSDGTSIARAQLRMSQLVRGQVKQTKTRRSMRPVPLQSVALEALEAWGARTPSSCGGEFIFVNQTAE
jgi:hypothetical protein